MICATPHQSDCERVSEPATSHELLDIWELTCFLASWTRHCISLHLSRSFRLRVGEPRSLRGGAQAGRLENRRAASVRQRPSGPVQTRGGHSVTPTQLMSLGRFPWSLGNRPSSSWSPLFDGRQSAALPDWTSCRAQSLGKTATLVPSRWSFLPAGTDWRRVS